MNNERKTISQKEFEQVKLEWETLNAEYDTQIQRFLDAPNDVRYTPEEREHNKAMQTKLFELEILIHKIESGTVTIS